MRTRSKPHSFVDNLARRKGELEAELRILPEGSAREALLQKIAQTENAIHMDGWLRSDLRAPT